MLNNHTYYGLRYGSLSTEELLRGFQIYCVMKTDGEALY